MHLSAQRLVTCRWCTRERPLRAKHCTNCGPPVVVRMVHDGLYGGLLGAMAALIAFLVVSTGAVAALGRWSDERTQQAILGLPAAAAVVGVVVGGVASIAWRWRGRRQAKQQAAQQTARQAKRLHAVA